MSLLSSLIGLSDDEDSYFLESGQGQMRKVNERQFADHMTGILDNSFTLFGVHGREVCYVIITMWQCFGVFESPFSVWEDTSCADESR